MDLQLLEFLPMLRCPVSRQPLQRMHGAELDKLNQAILSGKVYRNRGEVVKEPLQEALITANGAYVYPVVDAYIAVLLPAMAIPVREVEASPESALSEGKKAVQQFYDNFGWKKTEQGYNDTLTFEDRRPVSEHYWSQCHLRLNKYLPGGKYLLDVASGSIPNDEYLTYSHPYDLRICMDISMLALKEAALRLGGKGIFILGDMVRLPFQNACIDSVISMHTVYHIPREEQLAAVAEVYRVLCTGGEAVIVYSWEKAGLMRLVFGVWKPFLKLYKTIRGRSKSKEGMTRGKIVAGSPELFVQQQNYSWYANCLRKPFNAKLKVYSSISRSFSKTFLQEKKLGRQVAGIIYRLEDFFPSFMGRWGQYPVFLLSKKADPVSIHNKPVSVTQEKGMTDHMPLQNGGSHSLSA
jgi:ubiquinone/menaquinone biosynthesis C-methylase UbiE/uncharacterized protein YbaR (Trm112 family)